MLASQKPASAQINASWLTSLFQASPVAGFVLLPSATAMMVAAPPLKRPPAVATLHCCSRHRAAADDAVDAAHRPRRDPNCPTAVAVASCSRVEIVTAPHQRGRAVGADLVAVFRAFQLSCGPRLRSLV
jgi:hypothetical protein